MIYVNIFQHTIEILISFFQYKYLCLNKIKKEAVVEIGSLLFN